MVGVWKRLPIIVQAALTGIFVVFFGASVWTCLSVGAVKLVAAISWGAGPVFLFSGGLFLWGFWWYLSGHGWPRSTRDARRQRLRSHRLSGGVWAWALGAGTLAVISYIALVVVWGRLIHLQPWTLPDLSHYSLITVSCLLLGTAVEAGIVEESGFRGYMQVPLEEKYGPKVAIVIVSAVFGLVHLANGYHELTWLLPYALFGAILGTVAYLTNSVLPGVVLHAAGDGFRYLVVWSLGPNRPEILIWQSGPDDSFWICLSVAAVAGIAAVWAYRRLATTVRVKSKPA